MSKEVGKVGHEYFMVVFCSCNKQVWSTRLIGVVPVTATLAACYSHLPSDMITSLDNTGFLSQSPYHEELRIYRKLTENAGISLEVSAPFSKGPDCL